MANATSALGDSGTILLTQLLNNYYSLKNALVHDDAGKTDKAAVMLLINTDKLALALSQDSLLYGKTYRYLDTVKLAATAMRPDRSPGIEHKRLYLGQLSDAMYHLLQLMEIKHLTVYRQYCPMALNDKGAYWLSNEKEIQNPYFGRKMQECGEITDSLQ